MDKTPILDIKPYIPQYDTSERGTVEGRWEGCCSRGGVPSSTSNKDTFTASLHSQQLKDSPEDDIQCIPQEAAMKGEKQGAELCENDFQPLDEYEHNITRVASWVNNSAGLEVRFTSTALEQLDELCSRTLDGAMIQDREHVMNAVIHILEADPRSVYRKRKCLDRMYYFSVDRYHVTCWFDDENRVEVVRIKTEAF